MLLLPILLLVCSLFKPTFTYKVLIFNPAYGASHANFLGKIADILIDAGNEVTMLIPVYRDSKQLTGSKKITKIVKMGQDPRAKAIFAKGGVESLVRAKVWTTDAEMKGLVYLVEKMNGAFAYQCEYIFQQSEVLETLRNEHFDLGITESLFSCGFAIFDHIAIKTVINAESNLFKDAVKWAHGEPAASAYYPGLFSPNNDQMGFVARVKNMALMMFTKYIFSSRYSRELEAIKPYYNGTKSWEKHLSNVAFNFINSNQYLDYASPTLPKTVFIGGMQVNTKKNGKVELSQEWENVLSKRKQNVLVSFGSNAFSSDMPDEFKNAFLKVFASMPDTTFIWKYEEENATLASHLENVKLTTWMPQNDLLADPRLSLFVTHGGLGTTMELAYQGKPAVIIPLMADQPRNAHMLTRHGGALQVDKTKLNKPEEIKKAIQMVLNDPEYKRNAEKLAKILEEQPYSPKDVVLKHCDFAVKHGVLETLTSEGRNLNTFQFYSFDIALALIVILIVITVIILSILRCLVTLSINLIAGKTKKD